MEIASLLGARFGVSTSREINKFLIFQRGCLFNEKTAIFLNTDLRPISGICPLHAGFHVEECHSKSSK